jgi:hypothetical protein
VEVRRIGENTGLGFLTEDVGALFEEWSSHGVRFALPPTQPSWGRGQARYAVFEDVVRIPMKWGTDSDASGAASE